jgi:hypothetical protein
VSVVFDRIMLRVIWDRGEGSSDEGGSYRRTENIMITRWTDWDSSARRSR